MAKVHVSTTVNGQPMDVLVEPNDSLLDTLRDGLGLTGTKEGCATGDCGACSVMLDGRLVCSCLVLGAEAEGKTIDTIEGVADGDGLHVIQQKFLEHAALAVRHMHTRIHRRGESTSREEPKSRRNDDSVLACRKSVSLYRI